MDRLVAVLARKLESQDEPGFMIRLILLARALTPLALALCLLALLF